MYIWKTAFRSFTNLRHSAPPLSSGTERFHSQSSSRIKSFKPRTHVCFCHLIFHLQTCCQPKLCAIPETCFPPKRDGNILTFRSPDNCLQWKRMRNLAKKEAGERNACHEMLLLKVFCIARTRNEFGSDK